ncbi:hypothetical protein D3C83_92470 [compost metagenome]
MTRRRAGDSGGRSALDAGSSRTDKTSTAEARGGFRGGSPRKRLISVIVDHAFDTVSKMGYVKVDQQTDGFTAHLEVRQQLLLVNLFGL